MTEHKKPVDYFDIVFVERDEKPPFSLEFVECENEQGESVKIGEWLNDGVYMRLRIPLRGMNDVQ